MFDALRRTSGPSLLSTKSILRPLVSPAFGRIYFAVALVVAWEAVTNAGLVSPLILAAPSRAFGQLWQGFVSGEISNALLLTAYEICVGFLISAVVGLAFGYLFWRFETLGRACEPFLGAIFGTPTVLLYPIFLVLFGRTEYVPISMGIIIGVVPVIVNTHAGLSNVRAIHLKRGRSLGLTGFQMFAKILVPGAAPMIFSGLRLSLMYVMIGTAAVEYLVEVGGLGRLISVAYVTFKVPAMYGYIFVIVAIVVIMVETLSRLETRVR